MTGQHRKPTAFVLDEEKKPKPHRKIEFETPEPVGELVVLPAGSAADNAGLPLGFRSCLGAG